MKVGIMTFPNSTSYGAALQMYALYKSVKELGHDVQIINYYNSYMKAERHGGGKGNPLKHRLRLQARRMLHRRKYQAFRSFEGEMDLYPRRAFEDKTKLKELSGRYDAVICGSDQVWNPDITQEDLSYFLDFCGGATRRIAYAPSFGVETLAQPFATRAAGELKRFSALSVRETQGEALLEKLTGIQAPLVADPTFLLSPQDWAREERPYPVPEEGYILYYTIRSSASLMEFCRELSRQTGLKIVLVGGNALKRNSGGIHYACDIDPRQWLYLVRHANYVVTNSFHGTAFSINFRKDFYVEFSSLTNSRLEHIIRTLGLEQRIVEQESPAVGSRVDYTRTEQILPRLREDSLTYLKNAIGGAQ